MEVIKKRKKLHGRAFLSKKRGCAEKPLNWERIEERMNAGCTATEIAGIEGVSLSTFLERFQKVKGTHFSHAIQDKKESRNGSIRWKQFQQAMNGNTQLLLRLGEVYLGQGKETNLPPNDQILENHLDGNKTKGELEAVKQELAELKRRFGIDDPKPEAMPEPLPSDQAL